jgi:hypothetical protein
LEAVVHRNLKFLKEVLLDGYLVKEKLLEPAALSEVVSGTGGKIEYYCDSLLFFSDIETWLHKWPNSVTTNHGHHTAPTPLG